MSKIKDKIIVTVTFLIRETSLKVFDDTIDSKRVLLYYTV